MTICPDLWYDILSYIPHDSLREFSRASPIFHQLIYKANIRLFYDHLGKAVNIYQDDILIIRLSSGKKFVIKEENERYTELVDNRIINKDTINWTGRPNKHKLWTIDSVNGVAVSYEYKYTTFTSKWSVYGFEINKKKLYMDRKISETINYIDIDNFYAMFLDEDDAITVELEEFTIVYRGRLWTNYSAMTDN